MNYHTTPFCRKLHGRPEICVVSRDRTSLACGCKLVNLTSLQVACVPGLGKVAGRPVRPPARRTGRRQRPPERTARIPPGRTRAWEVTPDLTSGVQLIDASQERGDLLPTRESQGHHFSERESMNSARPEKRPPPGAVSAIGSLRECASGTPRYANSAKSPCPPVQSCATTR
jgi:hypothetical protein